MKKILAIMALITVVVFGVFASSSITVGAGGYGEFENSVYFVGPAIKLFTTSGNTFNDLTVESPMWVWNVKNLDDVSSYIKNFDIDDSNFKFMQLVRANETFGLALNLLGDSGPVTLTLGVGGAVTMDGLFQDANNRLLVFKVGPGAVADLGISLARPLSIVIGVSANYPLFGLRSFTNNGSTETNTFTIDESNIEASAHIGFGLRF